MFKIFEGEYHGGAGRIGGETTVADIYGVFEGVRKGEFTYSEAAMVKEEEKGFQRKAVEKGNGERVDEREQGVEKGSSYGINATWVG